MTEESLADELKLVEMPKEEKEMKDEATGGNTKREDKV